MYRVHVVAHTHWDREWYHTMVRFRQRLVALVDELLEDPPAPPASFLLDGQAIVLEDYLSVRPERAAELSALLQRGTLEAGPWYVLADELIPSAEALVRNLLVGRRALRALRAQAPPVLYCADSFGHPAALPSLADGFGLPLIVLWRGFGGSRAPSADTVRWRAPDGTTALVFHLPPDGYEYGSHLPGDDGAAGQRWRRMRDELGGRSRSRVLLVQNGADHHARQMRQREAIGALARAARETRDEVMASSLSAFTTELLSRVRPDDLPEIAGELRDSYGYTWTLQGTFATRAAQKRRNALVERTLAREAEPWAAIASRLGARARQPELVAAWKSLLQAHPHDTLCGCSIDAVAAAMDLRLHDAMTQALGIRDDALHDIVGHDVVSARAFAGHKQTVVVVRNPTPRARGGVALVRHVRFIADVPVGPGSAPSLQRTTTRDVSPALDSGKTVQILRRRSRMDRVESPRHYPDNDLVEITDAAVWVDAVSGYGTRSVAADRIESLASGSPEPVRVDEATIDNGRLRVSVAPNGHVTVEDRTSGRRVDGLLSIEDCVDRGDLYTPSIRETASTPAFEGARVVHRGPLIGALELRWRLAKGMTESRLHRGGSTLRVTLQLDADARFLRIRVRGRNRANDHRLRLGVRSDVSRGYAWADAAFGSVERRPIIATESERRMETPPPTAPLHRYVSVFDGERGATLFSDGLAEYEAANDGRVLVTLLRAVGELSRNDLPERPGHAGWPAPTPAAQCRGPFAAELALMLHGGRTDGVIDAIERAADDVLLPLRGTTIRDALSIPAPTHGVELHGAGLAFSAMKPAEDGKALVVRCVNLLDEPVDGTWTFGFPVATAHGARLDETVIEELAVEGRTVSFCAAPRAAVTILALT